MVASYLVATAAPRQTESNTAVVHTGTLRPQPRVEEDEVSCPTEGGQGGGFKPPHGKLPPPENVHRSGNTTKYVNLCLLSKSRPT